MCVLKVIEKGMVQEFVLGTVGPSSRGVLGVHTPTLLFNKDAETR